jgi:hypothetical protein
MIVTTRLVLVLFTNVVPMPPESRAIAIASYV